MRDANIRHTLGSINRRIKLASLISLLIIYSLVLVIARLLYVSIAYIPMSSIVAILAIIAGLVALSTFFVRKSLKYAVSRIEDFSEKIVSISRISRDISEIVHSDLLLNKIIDICLELTGADAGSIFLAEGDNLVLKAVRGGAGEKLTGLSIPKSQGIAGWVAANGETVRVDDVSVDSRFSPEVDERSGYKTVSLLCVPLRLSSGTIGVLELINKKNGVFINEDEAIALYLADQVSITIDRDRFYEDQKNYEIHLTSILLNVMDTLYLEKRGHAKRVAKYTLVMAQAMNMSEDQKKLLYRASLLHDIGMLRVDPETISSKEDYKAHSQIGYEMLYPINFYADIAPIILYHHERYDGRGYPSGLKGEEIPLESRMICIAEAFDAMISRKSYKYTGKLLSNETPSRKAFDSTIKELRDNAGTQFDPELVDLFAKNIDEETVEE